ncbi:MAG: methylmalonyl-CoA epimerase [Planctomycetes bacterium]|nr:methylmalonyl-CoA epimerase [Planctomycetota bacterium]
MQPPTRIDHLGIAVNSIAEASCFYRDALGLTCGEGQVVPEQKVRVQFFQLGEVRIELLEPTAADSPIARFLAQRGPGLHHIAYHVDDLPATLAALKAAGVRLIDEKPRAGAHGMKIAFAHPKSTGGVLSEFCQEGP